MTDKNFFWKNLGHGKGHMTLKGVVVEKISKSLGRSVHNVCMRNTESSVMILENWNTYLERGIYYLPGKVLVTYYASVCAHSGGLHWWMSAKKHLNITWKLFKCTPDSILFEVKVSGGIFLINPNLYLNNSTVYCLFL